MFALNFPTALEGQSWTGRGPIRRRFGAYSMALWRIRLRVQFPGEAEAWTNRAWKWSLRSMMHLSLRSPTPLLLLPLLLLLMPLLLLLVGLRPCKCRRITPHGLRLVSGCRCC